MFGRLAIITMSDEKDNTGSQANDGKSTPRREKSYVSDTSDEDPRGGDDE